MHARFAKHYIFRAPLSTHWAKATCVDVDCPAYRYGWQTKVLENDQGLGDRQAHYIRHQSGRRFTEDRTSDGWTVFTFEPGQRCFNSDAHRRRLDRPHRYYISSGGQAREVSPGSWISDFGEHQSRIADQRERG